MDLHNGLFWLLLFKVLISQGVLSNSKINNNNNLIINRILEATGSIIETCFSQYSRNILISDTWDKEDSIVISRTYSLYRPLRLVNLQDNRTFDVSSTNRFLSAYTDKNYVISISSKKNLLIALQKLKNSKSWDHGGFFVVIYKNLYEGCKKNEELLELIWSFNILGIILLCGNLKNQIYLYTYNPYTNVAPIFWIVVKNPRRRNNDIWILKHKLKDPLIRVTLLNDLDFDKAKNLAGYTIKIGVGFSKSPKYDVIKVGNDRYLGKMGALSRLIWNHLNGSIEVRYYPTLCLQDKMNQKCDIFKDLIDGKIDYLMNSLFMHAFWKYHTFPKGTLGLCALAAMNKKTISEKFMLAFTSNFLIIMGSTTLFIIIFLKYLLNRSTVICLLETLRMFLYMPNLRQPQQTFKRSLFVMLIFLTMTLNWNFQSRLSALFVVPDVHPFIDSLQDLEKSHLPVYGRKDFREFFFPSDVYYHYGAIDQLEDCIQRLESGNSVACIFPCSEKNTFKQSERVHVAKLPLKELFVSTYVRSDWPLFLKINDFIQKLYEAGFFKLFEKRETELFNRVVESKEKFVKLSLSNLYISSLILTFGLTMGTCVLILEVVTKIFLDY